MLKKTIPFLLVFMALNQFGFSQKYHSFDFDNETAELSNLQKEESESIIKKIHSVEIFLNEEQGYNEEYVFNYKQVWVNSDESIKNNNKVYLASRENSEYIYQKARVIKPSGAIIDLKETDIKKGIYEETEVNYEYYAIEGLEKGSIIETCSYKKSVPTYYGSLVYLQGDIKTYHLQFELICPQFLLFKFKTINSDREIQIDTNYKEGNRWFIEIDTIKPVEDQPNIYPDVIKSAVLYKLDRNLSKGLNDITSYGTASKNLYNNLHQEISKKSEKTINKILKELKITSLKTEREKIRAIENYLKENYQVYDNTSVGELRNIDFILENKSANETGITKLCVYLLEKSQIEFEIVLTSDRSKLRFDEEFEAFLFLSEYLIFFPNEGIFMAPTENFLRSPYIPRLWSYNYGLFLKQISLGDVSTAIGKIKFIDALPYDASKDIIEVNVKFDEADISQPEIDFARELTGYSASYYQPYLHLLDEEKLKDIKKTLVEWIHEDLSSSDVLISNFEINDFGNKPFKYEFTSEEHSFIERAGEDLLFKIGELIGPQLEMYQEKEREYDVESDNNRYYERKIKFNIPDGYTIKNLEKLKMSFKYSNSGNENLFFESDYIKNENGYEVTCIEYYTDIIYPKESFENYKKVINAAADFNKIVLVLERIK